MRRVTKFRVENRTAFGRPPIVVELSNLNSNNFTSLFDMELTLTCELSRVSRLGKSLPLIVIFRSELTRARTRRLKASQSFTCGKVFQNTLQPVQRVIHSHIDEKNNTRRSPVRWHHVAYTVIPYSSGIPSPFGVTCHILQRGTVDDQDEKRRFHEIPTGWAEFQKFEIHIDSIIRVLIRSQSFASPLRNIE